MSLVFALLTVTPALATSHESGGGTATSETGTCTCRDGSTNVRQTCIRGGSAGCASNCGTLTPVWEAGETSSACRTSSGSGEGGRKLDNPIAFNTIEKAVGGAVRIFTGISGSVALLMFIYGGILMMTSGGNMDRVSKGKKVLVWSVAGLALIFMSYAILNTLFTYIGA